MITGRRPLPVAPPPRRRSGDQTPQSSDKPRLLQVASRPHAGPGGSLTSGPRERGLLDVPARDIRYVDGPGVTRGSPGGHLGVTRGSPLKPYIVSVESSRSVGPAETRPVTTSTETWRGQITRRDMIKTFSQ
ncbi:hypothetical protein EYF80_050551 [Liparis tanakae]|uniref:Uncharacterized protein n=1 Tax=Liparis tanakae TaxID=230148 RepID=A0A4Z2FFV0_9TELE|nr:hypothetical protein EYF80_050551 [Liparis tanakae]